MEPRKLVVIVCEVAFLMKDIVNNLKIGVKIRADDLNKIDDIENLIKILDQNQIPLESWHKLIVTLD